MFSVESEEDSEEDEGVERKAKGIEALIEVQNPNRAPVKTYVFPRVSRSARFDDRLCSCRVKKASEVNVEAPREMSRKER
jgi:hypothetical protein